MSKDLLNKILELGYQRYWNLIFTPAHADFLRARYITLNAYIIQGYVEGRDEELLDFIFALETDREQVRA